MKYKEFIKVMTTICQLTENSQGPSFFPYPNCHCVQFILQSIKSPAKDSTFFKSPKAIVHAGWPQCPEAAAEALAAAAAVNC